MGADLGKAGEAKSPYRILDRGIDGLYQERVTVRKVPLGQKQNQEPLAKYRCGEVAKASGKYSSPDSG